MAVSVFYANAGNLTAEMAFDEITERMYPKNLHRRQWARDNLEMFYNQEMERIKMWQELASAPVKEGYTKIITKRYKVISA